MTELSDNYKDIISSIVIDVIEKYSPVLSSMAYNGQYWSLWNNFTGDNFSMDIEYEIDDYYYERFQKIIPNFVWISEQRELTITQDNEIPRYVIIIDPIDTTELACRGLAGHTHVTVFDRILGYPIITIIGDFFKRARLYTAVTNKGIKKADVFFIDGSGYTLHCSKHDNLDRAWISIYTEKFGVRFKELRKQCTLIAKLSTPISENKTIKSRVINDYGCIGFCHVAGGLSDAMIETSKGFNLWDLVPGQHILEAAGGFVTDLYGNELGYNFDYSSTTALKKLASGYRQRFIAAGNKNIIDEIRRYIII